jgi:hypothetical protein
LKHMKFPRLTLIAAGFLIYAPVTVKAQGGALHGPSEDLVQFLPKAGEILGYGTNITASAEVNLIPDSGEAVEYTAVLIVNQHAYRPFKTTLTPGATGHEKLAWKVRVRGPKVVVFQLQLRGVGQLSGKRFNFADITRSYVVRCSPDSFWLWRCIHRFFGCCT